MAELEALVEEYAAADGLDRRRMPLLEAEIIDRAWSTGLAAECGLVRVASRRASPSPSSTRVCATSRIFRSATACTCSDARRSHRHNPRSWQPSRREWSVFRGGSASHDRKRRRGVCNERARGFAGRARRPSRSGGAVRRAQPWPRRCPPYWTQPDIARSARRADSDGCCHRRARGKRSRSPLSAGSRRLSSRACDRPVGLGLVANRRRRPGAGVRLSRRAAESGISDLIASPASKCLPLAVLDRPRIDVTLARLRLVPRSFRDPDRAVRHGRAAKSRRSMRTTPTTRSRASAAAAMTSRAYSAVRPAAMARAPPTAALDATWSDRGELGAAYLAGVTHAFDGEGVTASGAFQDRIAAADALVHPQDDRERDVLDGDGVADFAGGFAAAAALLAKTPALYHLDTSRPDAPKARTAGRGGSPRRARPPDQPALDIRHAAAWASWRRGDRARRRCAVCVRGNGRVVPALLFDLTHAALIADEAVLAQMLEHNPAATGAIAARLHDALARGLWVSRRNSVARELDGAMKRAGAPPRAEAAQ